MAGTESVGSLNDYQTILTALYAKMPLEKDLRELIAKLEKQIKETTGTDYKFVEEDV